MKLADRANKGYDVCWVVERHELRGKTEYVEYWTMIDDYWFTTEWDKAIKFYDRTSAERVCVDMPDSWDIRIMEHQIMLPVRKLDQ